MAEWVIIEPIALSDHAVHVWLRRGIVVAITLYVNCTSMSLILK